MVLVQSFSGIRGIYPRDITEDIVRRYAYVFHEFLKKKLKKDPLIVIGSDTRESSPNLKGAAFDSLFHIIDVGIATTPAIEFAVREFKADGGIIITASHNEPEYNGIKFLDRDGAVLRPDDAENVIDEFKKIIKLKEDVFLNNCLYKEELKNKVKKVYNKNKETIKKYSHFLLDIVGKSDIELIKKNKPKIILDPNGGTALIAKDTLEGIGVKTIAVNEKSGEFKRRVNPDKDSLGYLKETIKENNADFAIGFDCDGDRAEILLRNRDIVSGNEILALLVDGFLSETKNPEKQVVVTNDATSGVVKAIVEKNNAKLKEVEVGEINVVDGMLINNSQIGGEGSCAGGILLPNRCRDGILTLLLILKSIAKKGKKLEELIKELPKFYNVRKEIRFDPKDNNKIKNKIKKYYLDKGLKIQETGDITGGLKVIIDNNSWVWFRASKTEGNLFRIIADSDDKEKAEKLLKDAIHIFTTFTKNQKIT